MGQAHEKLAAKWGILARNYPAQWGMLVRNSHLRLGNPRGNPWGMLVRIDWMDNWSKYGFVAGPSAMPIVSSGTSVTSGKP